MRCAKVRELALPYLDSELSPETSYAIARHADGCAPCRARIEGELRAEAWLRDRLAPPASPPDAGELRAFDRALAATLRRPAARPAAVAAAVLAVLAAAFLGVRAAGGRGAHDVWPDLARAGLAAHERYVGGELAPLLESAEPAALAAYLSGELAVRADLGLPPAGVELVGARTCKLDRAPCAFVMARAGDAPLSLFLLDRRDGGRFPEGTAALEAGGLDCGGESVRAHAFADRDRIVLAVGALPAPALAAAARELAAPGILRTETR